MKINNEKYIDENKNIDSNIFYQNSFSIKITEISVENFLDNTFFLELFEYINEIHKKCEDINDFFLHIENYPNDENYRKIFPIYRFVIYHQEMYLLKIIFLFDRMLHLINFLYDCNLKGGALTIKNLKKKKHNINKTILNILDKFSLGVNDLRNEQNFIKHKGSLEIDELYTIDTYEFVSNINNNYFDEEKVIGLKEYCSNNFEKYKEDLQKKRFNNTIYIANFINDVLENLYPKFKEKLKNI